MIYQKKISPVKKIINEMIYQKKKILPIKKKIL
jgi:hypothetical protein